MNAPTTCVLENIRKECCNASVSPRPSCTPPNFWFSMSQATASTPVGRKQIREVLHTLEQQGVTIFLNSHLLAEVELFCREVAIIQKGKLALSGTVLELTSGSGYRLELTGTPESLETELRSRARSVQANNGLLQLLFSTREEANQALDLARANHCEVETFGRTRSTLEEIFMKTVEGE